MTNSNKKKLARKYWLCFNPLKTKRRLLYLKIQFVPRSKHFHLGYKTNQFMLFGANVSVCSEINTKPINTVWAERKIVER